MQQLYEKVSAMNSAHYGLRGQIVKAEHRIPKIINIIVTTSLFWFVASCHRQADFATVCLPILLSRYSNFGIRRYSDTTSAKV